MDGPKDAWDLVAKVAVPAATTNPTVASPLAVTID
jgi:hypothetical protein